MTRRIYNNPWFMISMYKSSDEWPDQDHSMNCLGCDDSFPHRKEGEAMLPENVSANATRILDIGLGDGQA